MAGTSYHRRVDIPEALARAGELYLLVKRGASANNSDIMYVALLYRVRVQKFKSICRLTFCRTNFHNILNTINDLFSIPN